MWGYFTSFSQRNFVHITGIVYKDILKKHAIPEGLHLIGCGFIMQQDNDPMHLS